MKTRNDCEIACDCVKRANVVLHEGLCEEIFARKHTATHKPTSAQPLSAPHSDQRDIHTCTSNKIASRCEAPRPPMTDVGTETAFRLDQRKQFRKKNIPWGQRSVDAIFTCVDLHVLVSRSINMLSEKDLSQKESMISGVRVQAGLYLDMLDADRSPNAVSVHAGTSQVDFEVDCPLPARSTRRFFDNHGKGNGNFV